MKTLSLPDTDLRRWWLQRPAREKLMLSACSLGVLLAAGDSLLVSPIEKRLRQAVVSEDQLQTRLEKLQRQLRPAAAVDPESLQQEQALRQRLQAAQSRVGRLQKHLADVAQLPQLLRTITGTVGSARLLELRLLDEGSAVPPAAAASAAQASAQKRIYRLPITLKVSGNWDELNALLDQIEQRAPSLQWQSLSLDNGQWPAIHLTLKAQVPSLQPRWGLTP